MKDWLKNRLDNSAPPYGFLSELQTTILVVGGIVGVALMVYSPLIAIIVMIAVLFLVLYFS